MTSCLILRRPSLVSLAGVHLVHGDLPRNVGVACELHLCAVANVVVLMGLGQFADNLALYFMLNGSHPKSKIVGLDHQFLNVVVPNDTDFVSVIGCLLPFRQICTSQCLQLLMRERQEEQDLIDTPNELVTLEVLFQKRLDHLILEGILNGLNGIWVLCIPHLSTDSDCLISNLPLAQVAGHHKYCIHALHKLTLTVCKAAFIKGLKQTCEDVRVSLLHLIK
mmetsp:Transcript_33286/g.59582  ORF Transcript_33286/g.59582 Transcript_33286/m.59582 type:complete len:222 (-) Transcript_33286:934-1599(-)